MSQWARENPEAYEQIAALSLSEQNAVLRHAIGYDPDYIRDMAEEQASIDQLEGRDYGPDAEER